MFGNLFTNLKNKALAALIERQMKNLPKEQQELIMNLIQNNPELFQKIAKEVEELKKSGVNEMYAGMRVMKKYEAELAKLVAPQQKIERKVITE
jgi:uncharacterized protein YjgD (DUF1641 family)